MDRMMSTYGEKRRLSARVRALVFGALLAVVLTAPACRRDSADEPAPAAAVALPPRLPQGPVLSPRCAALAQVLPLVELARTCSHQPAAIEDGAEACLYRLVGTAELVVRFAFLGKDAARARTIVARGHPGVEGRPAAGLGSDALAFYDRAQYRSSLLFTAGAERVHAASSAAACEVGPLVRLAGLVRERLAGRPLPK